MAAGAIASERTLAEAVTVAAERDAPEAAAQGGPAIVVGRRIAARYELSRLLGRGGMGAVYLARDLELGEEVALKLLPPSAASDAAMLSRFRDEVRLARRVTHANVARTFDLGVDGELRFLTMELVRGGSLRQQLDRGPLARTKVPALVGQICAGLAAAHDVGVVHRDLKPSNVLMGRDGVVKLTDFGIARALDRPERDETDVVGTPAYMAPEQLDGGPVEPRTDLYALGCMIYELLIGELPFLGDTPMSVAIARLVEPPRELDASCGLPEAWTTTLRRCLSRDPGGRPGSAMEVAEAFSDGEAGVAPLASMRSSRRPYAPLPSSEPGLMLTAPEYRGPPERAYLADAFHEVLVDLMSTTRGLRVSSARSAQTDPSPPDIDAVARVSLHAGANRLRVTVRLSSPDGKVLWTGRESGSVDAIFDLEDRIGRRMAEALRTELVHLSHRGAASPAATEAYLRARHHMVRDAFSSPMLAVEQLERCLEDSPGFRPAIAAHAAASLQAWFMSSSDGPAWEEASATAVARALQEAPDLPESHVADGIYASHCGDYRRAVRALGEALRIAPTHALAHDYLGRLQCEAGRSEEGLERLELANDLEPGREMVLAAMAVTRALDGDRDGSERALGALARTASVSFLSSFVEMRVAWWLGDDERALRCGDRTPRGDAFHLRLIEMYVQCLAGTASAADVQALFADTSGMNPRQQTLALQLASEAALMVSEQALALELLSRSAELTLVDLSWLDRCPRLDPLRGAPAFVAARRTVTRRTEAIWSGDRDDRVGLG